MLKPGSHLRYTLEPILARGYAIVPHVVVTAALAGGAVVAFKFSIVVLAAIFAALALIPLTRAVRRLFELRTTLPLIETDSDGFTPGEPARFYLRQDGPASFESLTMDLAGEETFWASSSGGGNVGSILRGEPLGSVRLFETGPFEISADHAYENTVTVRIPALPEPKHKNGKASWKIVLLGKIRGRVDVHGSYSVDVVHRPPVS